MKTQSQFSTLVDLLCYRAKYQAEQTAFVFLQNGEIEAGKLTYQELDRQARAIAISLQSIADTSERAILMYPSGLEFITVFFGCLYAGIIAVPAYPPQSQKHLSRLKTIASDANATVALTTTQILSNKSNRLSKLPALSTLKWLETDRISDEWAAKWQSPNINSDTLAFLQYTSGSTGNPKGVMVSHRNLMHNERIIQQGFGHTEQSIIVGWLPLFHDMGLIGNVLQPLYLGARCILMSPEAFLQRPIRWLKAISDFKATTSGGPNFAYELCVRKIAAEDRQLLDLSSWDVAFNGAEPVRAETLDRFSKTFEPCGFRRKAFYPCYGMAETTLIVTGGDKTDQAIVHNVDSTALSYAQVSPTGSGFEESQKLIGCGQPLLGMDVIIAHPENLTQCAPHEVGEIWVSGDSVARGYWHNSEATVLSFQAYLKDTGEGPFLRTGDLGYLHDGELFITGRLKDLIIIRGRNYYPQDIEQTVQESHPALQLNGGASFSIEVEDEEQLIVVHEVQRTYLRKIDANEVMNAIRQAISETHQLSVHSIVLLKPGGLPKTSSGKVQRTTCKTKFLENSLEPIASSYLETGDTITQPQGELLENLLKLEPEKRFQQLVAYLQQLIAYVLRVNPKRVDINQSLTALGVDSLNTLELQHRIEEKLAISLPMSTILRSSITNFAEAVLEKLLLDANEPSFIEIEPSSTSQVLSYGQRALWFVHQLAPQSTAYHVSHAVKIRASLDVLALQRAFGKLIERHAALRTNFSSISGEPIQKVHETGKVDFKVEEASTWSEEILNERLQIESSSPFDLEHDSLLRVRVFTLSSGEHLLLLTIHHIVIDFWSLAVVMDELSTLYLAEQNEKAASLPLLPISFQDYSDWQSEMMNSPRSERLGDYWQKQLSGDLPILGLHGDRPRPSVQTYNGNSVHFRLDRNLTKQLEDLSRNCGVTLYMTLLAAFQVWLFRYTGQEDILVGSPTNGRTHKDFAGLVGYFVNPLVLRGNLAGSPTFETFLSQVRQTVLDAFEHQDYPFALLVEKLQPNRDPSCTPIFQTMFVFQKSPRLNDTNLAAMSLGETGIGMTWGNLPVESYALPQRTAQFDLTLAMASVGDELLASFEYNTDLFDAATIQRMSSHFQVLLQGIIEKPDQSVSLLPLISEAERRQLLVEWNDTQTEYPQDKCIHELFEEQVEKTPDAVAVVFEEQQLTYRELNQRANQLAHYLQKLGVKSEVLVGICVERSLEMVVGMLGILKAGGAYVPLDPSYPTERLEFMLQDAQVSVLLTLQHLVESLPEHQAQVVCLDFDWSTIASQSQENLVSETRAENLAYVIYTSGSTGTPKGVMNTHRGIGNRLYWMQETYKLTEADRVLQKTPFGFDVSVWEFFWPLITGASLIVAKPGGHQDATYLVKQIAQHKITTIHFVPSMLMVFSKEPNLKENCRSLKRIICSGEALSFELQERFFTALECQLYNLYGPTEAAIDVTYWQCQRGNHLRKVPIGRPISNTQIYILNSHLQPVPVGVPGELHIGGAGLARGYFNRAELTAEKFISNPFTEGERLYKTGDKARYLPDGNIEFLGRLDHQVKIRGFRIELGEIEAVLGSHPEIRETVVIASEDVAGDKRLVAYLVVNQNAENLISQLREFLKQKLPNYMVPSALVILEALPLTPNGKIDRNSLPAPEPESLREGKYIAPRTPTEEIIVNIFAELLKIDKVGIEDNFFELGGHSLLATQLISRLRQAFEVELPINKVFEFPTVAQLEPVLSQLRNSQPKSNTPPIEPVVRETEALPLSWAQERLWFLAQLEEASATYNMPGAIRLSGHLNVKALQNALSEVVRRHEVLRTSFVSVEGTPVQVINPEATLSFKVVDLQNYEATEREALVQQETKSEAITPFDLETAPLVRCSLLQLETTESVLLLTMHHIISDGWSIGILLQELSTLYSAYIQGEVSPLDELEIQYADFAMWQRQWLNESVLQEQLNYWKQQLAEIPELLQLPTDRARPAIQTYRGQTHNFILDPELTQKLDSLCRKSGTTLFMLLQAALATLLSRYSGQSDITIGSPIANRNRREIESLIGFFVNTLVLRTRLSDNPSFEELLAQVRETNFQAYEHQNVPFEKLVEALQPERSLSHSPLFQVMFSLENTPMENLELPGLTSTFLEIESVTAKFDLTLSMSEMAEGLMGTWEYNTDLFNGSTIKRMAGHFQNLLEAIVENPQQRVGELPLLTEAERHELLVEWNDTQTEYLQDKCIHELFEEQVKKTPDAVAVVFEVQQLTYQELNQRANQLARYLKQKGVEPEVLVGICIERSIEMVVGLLGILKAGGAYVSLDPTYPNERLEFMLDDAQPLVLLTQQHLVECFPRCQAQIVCLDSDWSVITNESDENPVSVVSPSNLAYVIYTSGSTGKPKGVLVTHKGLCNMTQAQKKLFDVESTSCVLQFASISFDASVWEIFMAIVNGAMLVLGTAELLMLGSNFKQTISRHSVTHLTLPPSALNVLVTDDLQNTGQIIVAGESCSHDLVNKWSVGRHFFNAYGPTESTVCATVAELSEGGEKIPIGRPISNTQIYILDSYLQPVPIGVAGELHIGGVGLARGYLNRPELTAEKFIPNPFTEGERLYKTGDKGRYLPDGNIEFLGRLDHQVKIRGFRIELGEIESVLSSHLKVREAVVVAREDVAGDKRLVAYVVVNTDLENLISQLREFLKEKLPGYMVPSAFVTLEALPLTSNGKIDRKGLPVPELEAIIRREYVAPRTLTERHLAEIWCQIFNINLVGIHDNFFELGGHSLLVTKLAHLIRGSFQNEVSLHTLFNKPTIFELAQTIDSPSQVFKNNPPPTMLPSSHNTQLPLSFNQERSWLKEEMYPGSRIHNIFIAINIKGSLSVTHLKKSLHMLVKRHEILRTIINKLSTGELIQVILPDLDIPFQYIDISNYSIDKQEKEVRKLAESEANQKFDITKLPLFQMKVVCLDKQKEFVLFLTMDHIISDGYSLAIILEELADLYNIYLNSYEPFIQEPKIQYADFAVWQRQYLKGNTLHKLMSYWRHKLSNATSPILPTDRPRLITSKNEGSIQQFTIAGDIFKDIKKLSIKEKLTSFIILNAVFNIMLYSKSRQKDICILSPTANRIHLEIEKSIGYFINILVLRNDLSGNPTLRELLLRVKRSTLEDIAHEELPFSKMLDCSELLKIKKSIPVLFNFQNINSRKITFESLKVEVMDFQNINVVIPISLVLDIAEYNQSFTCSFVYNTELFDQSSISEMIQCFQYFLENMLYSPCQNLNTLVSTYNSIM